MLRRTTGIRPIAAALALALLVPAFADAQVWVGGPPPKRRFIHRTSVFARYNPLGLIYDGRFVFRQRLYYDESDALSDNFIGVGLAPSLSPAFGRIGAYVEFQPATILTFWANYEVLQYFGGFNFLQSYPSASSEFSDQDLRDSSKLADKAAGKNYPTYGTQLTLGGNFQFKVASVVLRSQFRLIRADYKLREVNGKADRVFYESVYDVMAPNQGWFLTNDADVLYQSDAGPKGQQWVLGLRHTVTNTFYDARHLADDEAPVGDLNGPMNRIGPLFAYTFYRENRLAWNAPTVFAGAQFWINHRYRAASPLPLFLIGFSADGDLMSNYAGKG